MSEENARALYAQAQHYTDGLMRDGWIEDTGFVASEAFSPADLFAAEADHRPLIVGLLGGTGVGKSSLLNRLAGSDIARTGVVRPTSMEITAYLYSDRQLKSLPDDFPRERFSEVSHSNDNFKDVMWIDMPDFDSEETENRDQVKQWLPYIDVLIYVVTPERYKDEEGWRLMIENGYRHAWLFVINQWDRADAAQFEDFERLLLKAGFQAPKIFRTVCNGQPHESDEFSVLSDFVASVSQRNIIAQLDQRGWLQRLAQAQAKLDQHIDMLKNGESEKSVLQSFDDRWQSFKTSTATNLELPFKEFSSQFDSGSNAAFANVFKSIGGRKSQLNETVATSVAAKTDVVSLWDDWSATKLDDALSQFELATSEHAIPSSRMAALTASQAGFAADCSKGIKSGLQSHLDAVLHKPGTFWQTSMQQVLKWLQLMLPLLALVWIGYRIFSGFVAGESDRNNYVGFDFLVNGLLLAGLAWFVPWLLGRFVIPSLPKAIHRALHTALSESLDQSGGHYREAIKALSAQRVDQLKGGMALRAQIDEFCSRSVLLDDPELNKMLLPHSSVAES